MFKLFDYGSIHGYLLMLHFGCSIRVNPDDTGVLSLFYKRIKQVSWRFVYLNSDRLWVSVFECCSIVRALMTEKLFP